MAPLGSRTTPLTLPISVCANAHAATRSRNDSKLNLYRGDLILWPPRQRTPLRRTVQVASQDTWLHAICDEGQRFRGTDGQRSVMRRVRESQSDAQWRNG